MKEYTITMGSVREDHTLTYHELNTQRMTCAALDVRYPFFAFGKPVVTLYLKSFITWSPGTMPLTLQDYIQVLSIIHMYLIAQNYSVRFNSTDPGWAKKNHESRGHNGL